MQKKIPQPYLTIVTVVMIVSLSFGIISFFSEHMFHTWVSYLTLTMIPAQIYISVFLKCKHPEFITMLYQPWKGFLFTGLIILVGAFVTPFGLYFVNGGFTVPTPFLITWSILSVVVLLWLAEIFHGWPFTSLIKNPLLAGAGVLVASYVIAYFLFNCFFNFEESQNSFFYDKRLDPSGLYPNWIALSFALTSAAAVLVTVLLFQNWPVVSVERSSRWSIFSRQPWDMIVKVLFTVVITCIVFFIGINMLELNPISYMVRFPVSFIFGTFISMNMTENRLFDRIMQPLRGILLFITCAIIGMIMFEVYYYFGSLVVGKELSGGPPTYQLELWIAPALLSVTFPIIVIITSFLNFWPLCREK